MPKPDPTPDPIEADLTLDAMTLDVADAEITDISFQDRKTKIKFVTDDADVPKSVSFLSPAPPAPRLQRGAGRAR